MKDTLSPLQVARALGVSESSLKRWCDQGLLAVDRTPGGHRRLHRGAVLAFVRAGGHRLASPELLGLPSRRDEGVRVPSLSSALRRGAEEDCRRVLIDKFLAGATLAELCDEEIAPALHDVGAGWEHGQLEVYEEHRASEIALRCLLELRRALPPLPIDAPRAVGGAAEYDPYRVPTAMVEIVLRELGWQADSYGPLLPADSLCEALRRLQPRLAWISVSSVHDAAQLASGIERVYQAAVENGAALVVGGQALTAELRKQVAASACCDTMRQLTSFARALHATAPAATPSRN